VALGHIFFFNSSNGKHDEKVGIQFPRLWYSNQKLYAFLIIFIKKFANVCSFDELNQLCLANAIKKKIFGKTSIVSTVIHF